MTSKQAITDRLCLNCSTRQAVITCNGCKDGLDQNGAEVIPAVYCRSQCQRSHYTVHASTCKANKAHRSIYRGATLAQVLLYRIRSRLWSTSIKQILSDDQGNIVVHRGDQSSQTHFIALPDVVKTHQDKDFILANLTCRMVLVHFHCLVVMMLKGEVSKFQELYLDPKNSRVEITLRSTTGCNDSNWSYNHAMIRLTLNNGEQFALDISGAQFGYRCPLLPWKDYFATRVDSVAHTKFLGHHRNRCKYITKPDEEGNGGIKSCNEEVAEVINAAIEDWQSRDFKLKDMLRLHEPAFITKREEFIRFVEQSIEAKREQIEKAAKRQAELESRSKYKDDEWIGKPWEEACDEKVPPSWL